MSLPSSFDSEGRQWAWDSTSLKDAETCLRLYYYRHIEGWTPARKSVHLLFGGWYATALERYHKLLALGSTEDEALAKVVHEALIATWFYPPCPDCSGRGHFDVTEQARQQMTWAGKVDWAHEECEKCFGTGVLRDEGKPWESDHNFKTRENLIRTIIWYIDQFGEDDPLKVVHLADGTPAVEYSFTFELTDSLVYCGHIDRLVEYQGELYVQDQKTTGTTVTQRYFEQFHHPDTQMTGYTFAGKVIASKPVKGVIIDAAQIAVGFSRFDRGFTFRTPAQLEEWHSTSLYHIERARISTDAYNSLVRANEYSTSTEEKYKHLEIAFPMNPTSCDKYGGCAFKSVCSRSPEVRPQFLKADFVQGPRWNPLERR